ncbi:hypothetical protein [Bradyrhizobium cytisi]
MMIDDQLARAHRNNIRRYRHLLQTSLTEFERQFVERRLNEEQSKLEVLVSSFSNEAHLERSRAPDSRLA